MVEPLPADKTAAEPDPAAGIVLNSMRNLCRFTLIKMVGLACGRFRRGNHIEPGIIQLIFTLGVVIRRVSQHPFHGIERKSIATTPYQ